MRKIKKSKPSLFHFSYLMLGILVFTVVSFWSAVSLIWAAPSKSDDLLKMLLDFKPVVPKVEVDLSGVPDINLASFNTMAPDLKMEKFLDFSFDSEVDTEEIIEESEKSLESWEVASTMPDFGAQMTISNDVPAGMMPEGMPINPNTPLIPSSPSGNSLAPAVDCSPFASMPNIGFCDMIADNAGKTVCQQCFNN